MNSIILLTSGIIFFGVSIFSLLYPEKLVSIQLESTRDYLEKQGWSDKKIDKWINDRKSKEWYLFYRVLGVFGLIVSSGAIVVTLNQIIY